MSLGTSDSHPISPYNISPESHTWVTQIKERLPSKEALDC